MRVLHPSVCGPQTERVHGAGLGSLQTTRREPMGGGRSSTRRLATAPRSTERRASRRAHLRVLTAANTRPRSRPARRAFGTGRAAWESNAAHKSLTAATRTPARGVASARHPRPDSQSRRERPAPNARHATLHMDEAESCRHPLAPIGASARAPTREPPRRAHHPTVPESRIALATAATAHRDRQTRTV
jgi:hypothetical protein